MTRGHVDQGGLDAGDFIAKAYQTLLGRSPDPLGFAHCLHRIRQGVSRAHIWQELMASDEARQHAARSKTSPAAGASATGALAAMRQLAGRVPRRLLRQLQGRALRQRLQARLAMLAQAATPASLAPLAGPASSGQRPEPQGAPPAWPPMAQTPGQHSRGLALVTIAAGNYLPQVAVLMASLREHQPESTRVVVWVDAPPHGRALEGGVVSIQADALAITGFADMTVRYNVLELSTAIKPFVLQRLLQDWDFSAAIYLDPDTQLFAPLAEPRRLMDEGASMVLTPHLTQPLPAPGEPNDHTILKCGAFNLGFIGVRNCADATDFLAWWSERLRTDCLVSFEQNLFTDQRWCDLAPGFVADLAILRHPGYNLAYWNAEHRTLQRDGQGGWLVNGAELVFAHFSGFLPERPEAVSRYQNRLSQDTRSRLLPLMQQYAQRMKQGASTVDRLPGYLFDSLPDGRPLPTVLRAYYRHLFPHPQAAGRTELLASLLTHARAHQSTEVADGMAMPAVFSFIHSTRADLQRAFDTSQAVGQEAFAQWMLACGMRDYGLEGLFDQGPR